MDDTLEYVNLPQVARVLQISQPRVLAFIREGKLAAEGQGSSWRIKVDDLLSLRAELHA